MEHHTAALIVSLKSQNIKDLPEGQAPHEEGSDLAEAAGPAAETAPKQLFPHSLAELIVLGGEKLSSLDEVYSSGQKRGGSPQEDLFQI